MYLQSMCKNVYSNGKIMQEQLVMGKKYKDRLKNEYYIIK